MTDGDDLAFVGVAEASESWSLSMERARWRFAVEGATSVIGEFSCGRAGDEVMVVVVVVVISV